MSNSDIHDFHAVHKDAKIVAPLNHRTGKPETAHTCAYNRFVADYSYWSKADRDDDDEDFYLGRLRHDMALLESGVTSWSGLHESALETIERETQELEAKRADEEAQARAKEYAESSRLEKIRLSQPSLLVIKTRGLSRTRVAAVAVLVKESLNQQNINGLFDVVKSLNGLGLNAEQAIIDALDAFGARITYTGYSFSFDMTGIFYDDLDVRGV